MYRLDSKDRIWTDFRQITEITDTILFRELNFIVNNFKIPSHIQYGLSCQPWFTTTCHVSYGFSHDLFHTLLSYITCFSAPISPGGWRSSAFYTHRTRTSTMFVKKSLKMHSVACHLLTKMVHILIIHPKKYFGRIFWYAMKFINNNE